MSGTKDLLRPFLNNQAYYQVDTPAIPQLTNRAAPFGVTDD